MTRPSPLRRLPAVLLALAAGALVAGCGQGDIAVPEEQASARAGAELFYERCSGCHSLDAANSFGSKPEGEIAPGERTNGPNFNVRQVSYEDALFAIRNGGFSGAIMPANIVVGDNAEQVARFLEEYSGKGSSENQTNPGQENQP